MSLLTSYQGARTSSVLMGNGSVALILGVGTVEQAAFREDYRLEERAACSVNKQEPQQRVLAMSRWLL